jgi:sulfatase modifying factor 1
MRHPISSVFGLAVLASVSLVSSASAVVNIAYVPVGNAGNAGDNITGRGSVAYNFQIAKNETTIGQYCEFLNAAAKSDPYALYNTAMASVVTIAGIARSGSAGSYTYSVIPGTANKPINYVSWFNAARFCNWLHNGQGSGSTETGAYPLNGAMSVICNKNAGATTWIPTQNEWYKAAYYDPTKGGTGGYWQYPTQSDALGGNTIGVPNSANYYDGDYVGSGSSDFPTSMALTDVGAYGANSESFYGTNDQGGNVWEWNDGLYVLARGFRGGCFGNHPAELSYLERTFRDEDPSVGGAGLGFRVAGGYGLVITLLPVFHGLVTGNTIPYLSDTTATLTATPSPGYLFTGWTGDATGNVNPLSILMNANKNIGATFSPDTNDNDGDSLNNWGEFATDGNPSSGVNSGKIVGKIATVDHEQVFTLTLPVRVGALADPADPVGGELGLRQVNDGLSYKIQASTDLASWSLTVVEVTGADASAIQLGLPPLNSSWVYRTFRAPGTAVPGEPRKFMRAVFSE